MVELGSEIKISDSYSYVLIHCIVLLLMRVIKFHASGSNLIVFEDQKEIPSFQPNVQHCLGVPKSNFHFLFKYWK